MVLAGRTISTDERLLALLREQSLVAVCTTPEEMETERLRELEQADALAVELGPRPELLDRIPMWLSRNEHMAVVLVDGGLSVLDRCRAFENGVTDSFPLPYQAHLLAERLRRLCVLARRKRHGGR